MHSRLLEYWPCWLGNSREVRCRPVRPMRTVVSEPLSPAAHCDKAIAALRLWTSHPTATPNLPCMQRTD